jgi:quercetin dioxygenase-like cupin family protein
MRINTLKTAPKVRFNIEGYVMHTSASLEVIHLCLQPGQAIPLHSNPFDVVACLVEGEATLLMGEKQVKLGLYDMAEIEKDDERGFLNSGILETRILILKKF